MKNVPLLVGTILGTVALVFGVAFFFSSSSTTPKSAADSAVVEGSKRLKKGAESSTVTVVEFSDLQCPACRAVQPLVTELMKTYGDKVTFVYRHYPLVNIHQHAQFAAQASEAAADQGKFWEYHDLLFSRQDEWSDLSSEQVKEKFIGYTQELQIDKEKFLSTMESEDVKNRIARDVSDGTRLNIQGTPTFYVNGVETPAQQLSTAVESALSGK